MDDAPTHTHRSTARPGLLLVGLLIAITFRGGGASASDLSTASAGPRLLAGPAADVLVRIRGGAICSGTPISGTRYVVTAAHCVLDDDGNVARRTVVRDGVEYAVTAVLVDTRYHDEPTPELDAAVLVMDDALPGPSAVLGDRLPMSGHVTLAGFQPLDTDGTLLRGTTPHDRPHPTGADGGVITVETVVAGCDLPARSVEVRGDQLRVPCGMVPKASGGSLLAFDQGGAVLVGVTSTVAADLSANGITPVSGVHRLLDDPSRFRHVVEVTDRQPAGDAAELG